MFVSYIGIKYALIERCPSRYVKYYSDLNGRKEADSTAVAEVLV